MTLLPFLLLSIPAASPPPDMSLSGQAMVDRTDRSVELVQMTIEQRVIIRVPMTRPEIPPSPDGGARYRASPPPSTLSPPSSPVIEWEEHKGPKCIRISLVRAAALTSSRGIDLMLDDHRRLRALLGRECRSADLYSGFYIQPNGDGSLCAERDRVLARSGASCPITGLRQLKPRD